MSLVVPLAEAIGVSRFGGKANALAEMLSLGMPVPMGFVIASEAQERQRGRIESGPNPIGSELAQELDAAWAATIGDAKAAVRSSALLEDSADASFAGQFHSVLNVESFEDLLEAVRACWESGYTSHASAYTARKAAMPKEGIPPNEMAVVVQRMVDAEYAGVIFSTDPGTASSDVLFAEWVDGMGEELVGGEKISGRCWLDRNGRELRTDHLSDSAPSDAAWRELTYLVHRIERHFGVPQDVEWAIGKGGALSILQARPITTQASGASREGPPPWLLPGRPSGGWTELQHRFFDLWDEYCPAVVTPLDWGLFTKEIWQASLTMLDEGDGVPSIDAVVVRFIEVPVAVDPATDRRLRHGHARRSTVETALPTWRSRVDSLRRRTGDMRRLDDAALMQVIEETGRLHGDLTSTRLLGMHEWIDGERSCAEELAHLAGFDVVPDEVLDDLCAGVEHETARMNIALEKLLLKSASATARSEWMGDFERFIEQFGHMEINGMVAHSARDDLLAYVETGSRSKDARGLPATSAGGASDRAKKQRQRFLDAAGDSNRESVDRSVSRLRQLRVVREDSKSLANLPLPILRDAIVEATRRLQSRGLLPLDATANLLTVDELRKGLVLGADLPNVLGRERVLGWKRQRSWLPPGFLGEVCRPSQQSFAGLAASSGNATGPARVVRNVGDFAKIEQGDVLVAPNTNPAWTILFGRIAAVVIENGSRLSHAAIVAREYGIPAVVGLLGICDALGDGEEVQVNGDAGMVERRPKGECPNG